MMTVATLANIMMQIIKDPAHFTAHPITAEQLQPSSPCTDLASMSARDVETETKITAYLINFVLASQYELHVDMAKKINLTLNHNVCSKELLMNLSKSINCDLNTNKNELLAILIKATRLFAYFLQQHTTEKRLIHEKDAFLFGISLMIAQKSELDKSNFNQQYAAILNSDISLINFTERELLKYILTSTSEFNIFSPEFEIPLDESATHAPAEDLIKENNIMFLNHDVMGEQAFNEQCKLYIQLSSSQSIKEFVNLNANIHYPSIIISHYLSKQQNKSAFLQATLFILNKITTLQQFSKFIANPNCISWVIYNFENAMNDSNIKIDISHETILELFFDACHAKLESLSEMSAENNIELFNNIFLTFFTLDVVDRQMLENSGYYTCDTMGNLFDSILVNDAFCLFTEKIKESFENYLIGKTKSNCVDFLNGALKNNAHVVVIDIFFRKITDNRILLVAKNIICKNVLDTFTAKLTTLNEAIALIEDPCVMMSLMQEIPSCFNDMVNKNYLLVEFFMKLSEKTNIIMQETLKDSKNIEIVISSLKAIDTFSMSNIIEKNSGFYVYDLSEGNSINFDADAARAGIVSFKHSLFKSFANFIAAYLKTLKPQQAAMTHAHYLEMTRQTPALYDYLKNGASTSVATPMTPARNLALAMTTSLVTTPTSSPNKAAKRLASRAIDENGGDATKVNPVIPLQENKNTNKKQCKAT